MMSSEFTVNSNKGFTLIELVVVIVVLGILAAVAAPKFINLSADAKTSALRQISGSVKQANDFLFLKSKVPSYSTRPVPNRNDLIDIDMDNNGTFDVFGDIDVRLKYNHIDNTDILKRVDISDDFTSEEEGIDFTYIGYDSNNDGKVKDDLCYFRYRQAQNSTTPPTYLIVNDGC